MLNAVKRMTKPEQWSAFPRGILAYGTAEAATRAVRLVSILIVARQISVEMLGASALALSLFEMIRVLTSVGIGQRLIAAHDEELAGLCSTAQCLFWLVCLGVMIIQFGAAGIAYGLFELPEVAAMLAVLALVYPLMPAGLVHIFLAMRAQRMAATARVVASQNIADSVMTVLLVLVWPSAWALVLPKLLTAPIWLVMARRTCAWKKTAGVTSAPIKEFALFGPAVLGTELLAAARLHGDKLLIGALLGTEALGIYFFAFSAGLGITQSLIAACNLVLFPQLAKTPADKVDGEFRRAFVMGIGVLFPIVAAQALLAPLYVPVIFGSTWVEASPFLALLACAALPLFAGSMLGARSRALGNPLGETALMSIATMAALGGLSIGAHFSLEAACFGYAAGLGAVLVGPTVIRFLPEQKQSLAPSKGEI